MVRYLAFGISCTRLRPLVTDTGNLGKTRLNLAFIVHLREEHNECIRVCAEVEDGSMLQFTPLPAVRSRQYQPVPCDEGVECHPALFDRESQINIFASILSTRSRHTRPRPARRMLSRGSVSVSAGSTCTATAQLASYSYVAESCSLAHIQDGREERKCRNM